MQFSCQPSPEAASNPTNRIQTTIIPTAWFCRLDHTRSGDHMSLQSVRLARIRSLVGSRGCQLKSLSAITARSGSRASSPLQTRKEIHSAWVAAPPSAYAAAAIPRTNRSATARTAGRVSSRPARRGTCLLPRPSCSPGHNRQRVVTSTLPLARRLGIGV